ncbi:MAG: haloacid dehalogenase-like hydrolase [Coriobacteriales bacterium]|nr:haloacid dehalogenase-like hydrolase [Coriobacteriales bacterium]
MKTKFVSVAAALLVFVLVLAGCGANNASNAGAAKDAQDAKTEQAAAQDATGDTTAELASWTEDSPTVKLVKEYVAKVTDESSPDFIPAEDRIVTIDWDGTLFAELDPIYFDWNMYVHRTLWDSTYTPTDEQVEVAQAIEEVEETRKFPDGLEAKHAKCLAEVFKGMSIDDFYKYVAEFGNTDAPKFTGLKRKDGYYKPMIELVNYFHDNGFECFVVSGTDRNVLRTLLPEYFPWMDNAHIKGSVSTVEASGQNGEDGLEYTWTSDDSLVEGGELVIKDVKANKPSIIATEIGKQPVVSLGNSSGDSSMANYTVNNNKYQSIALMLCCDDTERDWGELDKAEKMAKSCEENGWHAVSQKNEWKTIYGETAKIDKSWEYSSEKCNQAGPNARETEYAASSSSSDQELAQAA